MNPHHESLRKFYMHAFGVGVRVDHAKSLEYAKELASDTSRQIACKADLSKSATLLLMEGLEHFFVRKYNRAHFLFVLSMLYQTESPMVYFALLLLYLECPFLIPRPRQSDPFVELIALCQACSPSSRQMQPIILRATLQQNPHENQSISIAHQAFPECFAMFTRNWDAKEPAVMQIDALSRAASSSIPFAMLFYSMDKLSSSQPHVLQNASIYLNKLSSWGHPTADLILSQLTGYTQLQQSSHPRNLMQLLISAANSDHPYALYEAGIRLIPESPDRPQAEENLKQARAFLEKAVCLGHSRARLALVIASDPYNKRQIFSQEYVNVLQEMADEGCANAMYDLACRHLSGDGLERSDSLAAVWLQRGVLLGHVQSIHGLAICHYHGTGVEKNVDRALDLLEKAAESKYYPSIMALYSHHKRRTKQQSSMSTLLKWEAALESCLASRDSQEFHSHQHPLAPMKKFFPDEVFQPTFQRQDTNTTSIPHPIRKWAFYSPFGITILERDYKLVVDILLQCAQGAALPGKEHHAKNMLVHMSNYHISMHVPDAMTDQFKKDMGHTSTAYFVASILDSLSSTKRVAQDISRFIASLRDVACEDQDATKSVLSHYSALIDKILLLDDDYIEFCLVAHRLQCDNINPDRVMDILAKVFLPRRTITQLAKKCMSLCSQIYNTHPRFPKSTFDAFFLSVAPESNWSCEHKEIVSNFIAAGLKPPAMVIQKVGISRKEATDTTSGFGFYLNRLAEEGDMDARCLLHYAFRLMDNPHPASEDLSKLVEFASSGCSLAESYLCSLYEDESKSCFHPSKSLVYWSRLIQKTPELSDRKLEYALKMIHGMGAKPNRQEAMEVLASLVKGSHQNAFLPYIENVVFDPRYEEAHSKQSAEFVTAFTTLENLVAHGNFRARLLMGVFLVTYADRDEAKRVSGWELLLRASQDGEMSARIMCLNSMSFSVLQKVLSKKPPLPWSQWAKELKLSGVYIHQPSRGDELPVDPSSLNTLSNTNLSLKTIRKVFKENKCQPSHALWSTLWKLAHIHEIQNPSLTKSDLTLSSSKLFEHAAHAWSMGNASRCEALLLYSLCVDVPHPFQYLFLRALYLSIFSYGRHMGGHALPSILVRRAQDCPKWRCSQDYPSIPWLPEHAPSVRSLVGVLRVDVAYYIYGVEYPTAMKALCNPAQLTVFSVHTLYQQWLLADLSEEDKALVKKALTESRHPSCLMLNEFEAKRQVAPHGYVNRKNWKFLSQLGILDSYEKPRCNTQRTADPE